jgi:hypothetical protein
MRYLAHHLHCLDANQPKNSLEWSTNWADYHIQDIKVHNHPSLRQFVLRLPNVIQITHAAREVSDQFYRYFPRSCDNRHFNSFELQVSRSPWTEVVAFHDISDGAFIMLQLVVYWGDDHDLRITTPGAEGIQKESIFVSLHRAVRTRSATDPKDKAYAMYGILKGLGSSLSNPDYSKSVWQIYLGFFLDLLNWGQSLNLILDGGLPGLQNAPSWLPDWSAIAEED